MSHTFTDIISAEVGPYSAPGQAANKVLFSPLQQNGHPISTVTANHWRYTINQWRNYNLYQFLTQNHDETIQSTPSYVPSLGQKIRYWNQDESNILNHDTFYISTDFHNLSPQYWPVDGTVTVKTDLIDAPGTTGGVVQFRDPWYIDYPDPQYGGNWRNRGMQEARVLTRSLVDQFAQGWSPDFTTTYPESPEQPYRGVFLDQDYNIPGNPHYSLGAPLTQTIGGYAWYFQNWHADPNSATLQDTMALQTDVNFKQAGATVSAYYKGVHLSSNGSTFATNGQRKFVRTEDGTLHLVYDSNGHIWYEISTDSGVTWTIANGGKPLDAKGGKLPAIDCQANYVVIVWQESYYGAVQLKVGRLRDGVMGWQYPLQAFVDPCQSYAENLNPVIGYDFEQRAVIAWENKSDYIYPIGIVVKHGPLGSFPDPITWETDYSGAIPSTNANCVNPTIAVAKNPTDQYNMMYHLAWQYNQSPSYSYIKHCKLTANSGGVTLSSITTPSDGGGFWQNRHPSVASMDDNTARLVWDGYAPWYGNRAVFRSMNPDGSWSGTVMNMGSNVLQAFVNSTDDDKFVIAWVQNNVSLTNNFVKSDNLYGIKSFATNGNNLQLNYASSYNTMYAMAFRNQAVPYSFAMSSSVGSIPKEAVLTSSAARAVVLSSGDRQFCYGVGDVSASGSAVGFASLPDMPSALTQDDLGNSLKTVDFQALSDSMTSLTIFQGTIDPHDTASAASSSGGLGEIAFRVLLLDAGSGTTSCELARSTISDDKGLPTDITSYRFSMPAAIVGREVKIAIQVGYQESLRYTINECLPFGAVAELAKSGFRQLSLSMKPVATTYCLEQNYPNPFNPETQIDFALPEPGHVSLIVFDALGRETTVLVKGYHDAGWHRARWEASAFSSGVYYARLTVMDDLGSVKFSKVSKLLLVK